MAAALAFLALGAVVLYVGAEAAVRGASGLARRAGMPAFALGAILFGVDIEGLGAALTAAGRGETEIAAGESFGTILFLFTAAFGAALLLARGPIEAPPAPMLAAPAVAVAAAALVISDRHVSRIEGVLLVLLYAAYVVLVVRRSADARTADPEPPFAAPGPDPPAQPRRSQTAEAAPAPSEERGGGAAPAGILVLAGLGILYVGAALLVAGGVRIAARTGLASGFVGAAIIGALASLDEVLLEVLPVRRGDPELATGNLLGTLVAFTTGVLGLAALVRPLDLDGAANLAFLAVALLYALIATTFFFRGRAGRALGVVVIAAYVGWLAFASSV